MARLAKQNEELSKEIGRSRLRENSVPMQRHHYLLRNNWQLESPHLLILHGRASTAIFQAISSKTVRRRNGQNAAALIGSKERVLRRGQPLSETRRT